MCSLQTGMRGAFGKPTGKVARVNIGQPIMSIRAKDAHKEHVVESLRRAKFKFPGRQLVIVSRFWDFTKFTREEYAEMQKKNVLVPDGASVKHINGRGSLNLWKQHVVKHGEITA